MRKLIPLLLALMLALSPALAAPQLSDSLFAAAKQAAEWLVTGRYDRLADAMPFSGAAPDADEWASFAANYAAYGHAQQDYAVAYWINGGWRVAVPMLTPDDGDVEVLLLTSEDGYSFSGYRYAAWSQVESEYAVSDHVVWNDEYVPFAPRLFAD